MARLLLEFSGLPRNAQSAFLDTLNLYLYASPKRRARLREQWHSALDDPAMQAGPRRPPGP